MFQQIRNVKLGEKVNNLDTLDLIVRLPTDSNDVINLKVDVEGCANDPKFSAAAYGSRQQLLAS